MNKSFKTAILVITGAVAATAAFAEGDSSTSQQDNQAIIREIASYDVNGKVVSFDKADGTLTVKTFDGEEIAISLKDKTQCTFLESGNVVDTNKNNLKKGQIVKVKVDGNLNAKNVTVYLY